MLALDLLLRTFLFVIGGIGSPWIFCILVRLQCMLELLLQFRLL